MFLADVVAAYVESLTEREFDAPVIALLHYLGFDNIHLIHGQFEFGQDFVAQREEDGVRYQYCLQSKAGNIGMPGWRDVRPQLDEMRTGKIAHPNYNPKLPRRLVFITNGRLVGAAASSMQMYNEHHADRDEAVVEFWGIEKLLNDFEAILVEGVPATDRARTLELLGRLELGTATRSEVRSYANTWLTMPADPRTRWAAHLTAGMLVRAATTAGREDLAAQTALLLLRSAYDNPTKPDTPSVDEIASARRLFEIQADHVWRAVRSRDPVDWTMRSRTGTDLFVTHPVRTARLCESLALLGVLTHTSGDHQRASDIADTIEQLITATPALSHTVADDWAFSLLATVTHLATQNRYDTIRAVLTEAAMWLLDRLEDGSGLAKVGEAPHVAIKVLLGYPYAALRTELDPSTYTATVILDCAYLTGHRGLYEDLLHDLKMLDAFGCIVAEDPAAQTKFVARIAYQPGTAPPATHYGIPADATPAGANQSWFDCIARWATMRDRHQPAVLLELIAASPLPDNSWRPSPRR